MATATVSALGGNWSSTTTWVGLAIPAVGDDIVANATSGPLTVDSNRTCLTINFTGYTNATGFTISNGVTLSISGTAITLGSGMTYNQTTTGVLSTVGNVATTTIIFAGITIPNLTIAKSFNGNAVAISGTTPTVKNLVVSSIGASTLIPLTGTALTVTNSIIVDKQLGGSVPIIFSGAVTLSGTNVLNTGFTVPALSILTIGSNIAVGGTITFAPTSSLIPGTYTVSISYGTTLDSSAVTWYNIFIFNASGVTVTLISDWIISNNLSWTNGGATSFITAATTKTVTIQGSFTPTTANVTVAFSLNNIILNLTGQGTFAPAYLRGTSGVVNINTSNPTGYVIGSSMFTGANTMILGSGMSFNLVGTSVATAFSGTTLQLRDNTTIDTNRTSVGGSNPIYSAIIIDNSASITTEISCSGNLSFASYVSASTSNANGAKILFGGNLSTSLIAAGTSTLEFTGSSAATWGGAGSYRNNIIVNKSSAAVVTAASAITWGVANAVLTLNSTVNFSTNSNTFTLSGTPLTINNSISSQFFNMTIPASTTLTLGAATTPITGTLALAGSATFQGTYGWTCGTLTCSLANSIITLQSGVTYTTTNSVTMLGTNANKILMTSSAPTITYAIWTLQNPASQSMVYVSATAIDSSLGMTIYSFGGIIGTTAPVPTLNWALGASQGTKAFTFVS